MNEQALRNLLSGTRYNITQIDGDLAAMAANWSDDMLYSQGYANGRKAELEKLATTLEMALAVFKS